MNEKNSNSYNGGLIYVETETDKHPTIGSVCTGWKLREGKRVKGFITTDEEISCRVTHIVKTQHTEHGFYVIGHQCKTPEIKTMEDEYGSKFKN